MEKNKMDYWWFQNKQNRTNNEEQILPIDDLRKLEKYIYSYYSNSNFLGIKDYITYGNYKYPVRLDKKDDFMYFSTLLAEPKIFDNGLEYIEKLTENDVVNFINNSARQYPENVARYYRNDGTYQYILLDRDDQGKLKIKIVPDRFIASSYTAFRPVFVKEQVKNEISPQNKIGDEYKFLTEDGCYLLNQDKIESFDDVLKILKVNPLYLDQINAHYFTKKHDPESSEIDNIEKMKEVIYDFFTDPEKTERLCLFARSVFDYGVRSSMNFNEQKQSIIEEIVNHLNGVFRNKKEELEFLNQYVNYSQEKAEEDFVKLGLIPNVQMLKDKFYPIKKSSYDKNKTFLQRRYERLRFLKDQCEKLEKYREEVMSKIKPVPDYNPYVNNGQERAEVIENNEIIHRYEQEVLSSGYRYKNKNTGIISALNNEMYEQDVKIDGYFTLPSNKVISEIEQYLYDNYNEYYDTMVVYTPNKDHSSNHYNAKPLICMVNKSKMKDVNKYLNPYVIANNSEENKYIKKIISLIEEGIIIPIAEPVNNFKTCPGKINFRKPKKIIEKEINEGLDTKIYAIKTFCFKNKDLTCKKFDKTKKVKSLQETLIELVNNNVMKNEKTTKKKPELVVEEFDLGID